MTAGKPVVATDVGGNPELVSDCQNGFLAPPSNPNALAEKMMLLINDPGLRRAMAQKSQEAARDKFSLEKMIENYENIYEELLR
jgi:glycosyltransferase involved in cell wall biosynthesis